MSLDIARDVMQVCLGGHVITDVLASHPEQGATHCHRCGAATICRCPTCGDEIPGATGHPGLMTIGHRPPPLYCPCCGAAFPWAGKPMPAEAPAALVALDSLLRRLPAAARQLRDRHDGRPTLRLADVNDLEDLLRTALHLHFDDVRCERRTPGYATGVRTDFIVGAERIAVTAKLVTSKEDAAAIAREVEADLAYYDRQTDCTALVMLVYDPEQLLHDPRRFEATIASDGLDVRCCVVS